MWQKQGRKKEARQALAEVYEWFTEGFDTADLKDAKALLDEREITDVLLVTSASHMRRAQATFARVGIEAVPAATDQQAVTQSEQTLLDWMPDAEALFMTTVALKEYLGWYYYRGKGWL